MENLILIAAIIILVTVERIPSNLRCAVRVVTDAGGEYSALRVPLVGRSQVAQFFLRVAQRRLAGMRLRPCVVNGLPAMLFDS